MLAFASDLSLTSFNTYSTSASFSNLVSLYI
jgi:hypothetical protein